MIKIHKKFRIPWLGFLFLALLLPVWLLGGCASQADIEKVLPDRKVEYKHERAAETDLEVPPDLTRSSIDDAMKIPEPGAASTTTYSEYVEGRQGARARRAVADQPVLPEVDKVRVMRDRDERWLQIEAPPVKVWPRVVSFWRSNGILLQEQDPTVGIMKTSWLENRADIKSGFITDFMKKVVPGLHSAATRDQFRVRLEPGERAGTTDLYLTHRGMQEELTTSSSGETENTFWTPRPSDPGLEAEMLRRLMVYLGVADNKASRQLARKEVEKVSKSRLIKSRDGSSRLIVDEDYARAWRLVGVTLDRIGFAVEDLDRSEGVYYVRYDDPFKEDKDKKGLLSKLNFWSKDEKVDDKSQYQVKLTVPDDKEQAGRTTVTVLNKAGAPELSSTATRILTLLHEQIQ